MAHDARIEACVPCVVGRQRHRSTAPAVSPEEHFCWNLFSPFLDNIISQLNKRFCSKHATFQIVSCIYQQSIFINYVQCISDQSQQAQKLLNLVPSIIRELPSLPYLSEQVSLYKCDIPAPTVFQQELQRWYQHYKAKPASACPSSCAKAIKECDKDIFPNIYVLLQIACTLPVTS